MKQVISLFLVMITIFLGTEVFAAGTVEEAMGDVDIYSDGTTMDYLIAGRGVQRLKYAYYEYNSSFSGATKQIPAYCVNPNDPGVGQLGSYTVNCGTVATDPKLVGIVSNGYPRQDLSVLNLKNKYEGYYATKIALWCHLISSWDINNVRVNPACADQDAANRVLQAVRTIYNNGVTWTTMIYPTLTATPTTSQVIEDNINSNYYSQVFIVKANTYLPNGAISVAFFDEDEVPDGVKIVDANTNQPITQFPVQQDGAFLSGKFKVLYPKDAVEDIGQVQLKLSALQYKYSVFYGVSYDEEAQDYLCDTDPSFLMETFATSSYSPETELNEGTYLKINKYESGSRIPLEGCWFEVINPLGATVGTFCSDGRGEIIIPVVETGNYTVKELSSNTNHLIGDNPTQNVTVVYNETTEVTFYNEAFGNLEIEKLDVSNGRRLSGARIKVNNITTGHSQTVVTEASGIAYIAEIPANSVLEIFELQPPEGYLLDDTVHTVKIVSGKTSKISLKNISTPYLRIVKVDKENNLPLSNATFAVYRDTIFVGNYTTGEMGEILLTDLQEGTYLVKEVSIGNPSYVVDTYPQEIEVEGGKTAELIFFNLQKPGIHLIKLDSQTLEPIPNVTFEIKQIGGNFIEERMTQMDGSINLSDLEPSSFEIKEKNSTLNDYVMDDGVRVIKIEAGEPDAQFIFTNTKKPALNIIKMSRSGEPIANAVFSVAQIGKTPKEYRTNSRGIIYLEGLEPKIVSVVEKSVPEKYILDSIEYIVELFPGKTSQLVVVNDEKPKLKIIKTDAITGKPLEGTKFRVNRADGSTIGTYTIPNTGEILLENMSEGVHTITEVYVPETHLIDNTPQNVTLVRNKTGVVQFQNQPKSSLTIIKTDAISNSRLEGAVFEIVRKDINSETSLGEFTTSETGEITIENLPFARYLIFERSSPRGYKELTESKEIIIEKHENRVVTFVNDALSPLYIKKIDSKTREPIANARFRITKMNGELVHEGNTDIYGFICIPQVEPGWYTATELDIDGYVLDQTPKSVEVKLGDPAIIEFFNSPYGNLVIQKTDNLENALEGVKFKITKVDGQGVGDTYYETDSEGFIRLNSIEPDFYLIKEEKTLDTHLLDETAKTVEVKSGETYTLKVVNDIKSGLIIKKTIKNSGGEPLKGVKFRIKEIDGTDIGTYKTNSSGTIFVPLEPCWITVQEIYAPEGFAMDTEVKIVEIKANEPTVLEVENEQMSGIRIKKINSETGEGIYGVRFLIKDAKNNIIGLYSTDQDGYVDLTYELSAGKYKLEEISTADGFVLDKQEKTIRVREGYTEEILWENEPEKGQIQILKKSAEYNEITKYPANTALQGSVFEIYNARNNRIVDRIISDERGIAASRPLPLGNYIIKETVASPFYQVNPSEIKAEIKADGDIVKFEVFNNNAKLGATVKKVGNLEVQAGSQMRYDISNVSNTSNVPLDNFYLHDRVPTDAVRLDKIVTGTWNQRMDYSIYYKTNYKDYTILVKDIVSNINHEILCSDTALGLMAGEYVTDIKFEFGTVIAGFKEVQMPMLMVTVLPILTNDYKIINYVDVAGKYLNEWQIASDVWITNVYGQFKPEKLPTTGY